MQRRLVVIICLMASCAANAAEESLQRLFTTVQERALIDQQKYLASIRAPSGDQQKALASRSDRLSFDALLIGAKKVVWINRQLIDRPTTVAGIQVDPGNLSKRGLWLDTPNGKKLLKQGQVYLTESGKVVERYEAL